MVDANGHWSIHYELRFDHEISYCLCPYPLATLPLNIIRVVIDQDGWVVTGFPSGYHFIDSDSESDDMDADYDTE